MKAKIGDGGNDNGGRTVDLAQKVIIHQSTAGFRRKQIRATTRGETNFERSAADFGGGLLDGLIFAHFSGFELSNPDLAQPLGFEQANIVFAQYVAFCQKLASAWPKN